jgi:hypothetical protein
MIIGSLSFGGLGSVVAIFKLLKIATRGNVRSSLHN